MKAEAHPGSRAALALLLVASAVGCRYDPAARPPAPATDAPATEATAPPAGSPWDDAARRGVTFRALGQEPGWSVEIQPGRAIELTTDYGANRVSTPVPEPSTDPASGVTTYRARTEAHDLEIAIAKTSCTDVMSGETFEAQVTVRIDGRELRGCGRWLAPPSDA